MSHLLPLNLLFRLHCVQHYFDKNRAPTCVNDVLLRVCVCVCLRVRVRVRVCVWMSQMSQEVLVTVSDLCCIFRFVIFPWVLMVQHFVP